MDYTKLVESKFCAFAKKHNMLDTRSILAAFSGGADSTVLLYILDKVCKKRGIELFALHVNHMIRGKEATRDENFCKEFAKEHSIPFECVYIDVPSLSKALGIGLEECARNCRYDAFEKYCKAHNIEKIATAHNANDNLETVIFNLARGCSLSGICGIPPVRDNIVRPLLLCSKDEILGYAKENSIDYIYDSTNSDTEYSRNYIRHKIIPSLEALNGNVVHNVARFTQIALEDDICLESIAKNYLQESDITVLKKLDTPILHRVISMKFEQNTKCHMENVHINSVEKLIRNGRNNSSISLPQKMKAQIENNNFLIIKDSATNLPAPYFMELVDGINRIEPDDSVLYISVNGNDEHKDILSKQNFYKIFIYTAIDFDKIYGKLTLRSRKEGDKYRYGGMTRSLKKLMNGKKLSLSKRATLPVICDEKGIVWVPGFGVRDLVAPDAHTKNICHLYYMKGEHALP